MARHLRPCLALLSVLALVGACKVSASASTSSADDAKADSGGSTAKPDSGGGEAKEGGDGDGATLSSVPAKPAQPGATDPSGSISAGASCGDSGHAPGDSWKDDCNTCNCTDAGEIVCTRMHCGDDDSAPH